MLDLSRGASVSATSSVKETKKLSCQVPFGAIYVPFDVFTLILLCSCLYITIYVKHIINHHVLAHVNSVYGYTQGEQ